MQKVMTVLSLLCAASLLLGCGSSAASVPPYDKEQMELSEHTDSPVSDSVQIVLPEETSFFQEEKITLRYVNYAEQDYTFTPVQRLEVLLDGAWYVVPDAQEFATLLLLTLPGGSEVEDTFHIEGRYEPLPQGQYRILKSFSDAEGNPLLAAADFEVG